MENLTGLRFERLIVVSLAGKSGGNSFWLCQCDCGAEKKVRGSYLKTGHSRSCGCLSRDVTTAKNLRHGDSIRGKRTQEYRSWGAMIRRCYITKDQKYKDYGGRGIAVCDRWRNSFENFLSDLGRKPSPKHTLDRYPDNDGNYEPGNVRWASPIEQANNQRKNLIFTIKGRIQTLAQWVREFGLNYNSVYGRVTAGEPIEAALGLQGKT